MDTPTPIILGGFAGAGKTTMTEKVSTRYGIARVSTDEINDVLRRMMHLDFKSVSPTAHEIAWTVIKDNLQRGVSMVLDINLCNDRAWEHINEIQSAQPFVGVIPIILLCPMATHKARIQKRAEENPEHLNLGGLTFEKIAFKYDYINNLTRTDVIKIDADQQIDVVYASIIDQIEKHHSS